MRWNMVTSSVLLVVLLAASRSFSVVGEPCPAVGRREEWEAFFSAMAVTIIFGLIFATILTMVILPVFYSIVFNVGMDEEG